MTDKEAIGEGTPVTIKMAIGVATVLLAVAGAQFHQTLSTSATLGEMRAEAATQFAQIDGQIQLVSDRQGRIREDVSALRDRIELQGVVTRTDMNASIRSAISELKQEVVLKAEAQRFIDFPWTIDREAVIQRIEALEKGLKK